MTNRNRKHDRIRSLNLLNYVCFDESGKESIQGMGRTLNVSQGGILLETHVPIDLSHHVALTIGIEDDLIDIKGKVVYCKSNENNKYESGIDFFEINDTAQQILSRYIIAFREQPT